MENQYDERKEHASCTEHPLWKPGYLYCVGLSADENIRINQNAEILSRRAERSYQNLMQKIDAWTQSAIREQREQPRLKNLIIA